MRVEPATNAKRLIGALMGLLAFGCVVVGLVQVPSSGLVDLLGWLALAAFLALFAVCFATRASIEVSGEILTVRSPFGRPRSVAAVDVVEMVANRAGVYFTGPAIQSVRYPGNPFDPADLESLAEALGVSVTRPSPGQDLKLLVRMGFVIGAAIVVSGLVRRLWR